MFDPLNPIWKFLIALLMPVFLGLQSAITDDTVTKQEWVSIAVAVVIALSVYLKGNGPSGGPVPPPPQTEWVSTLDGETQVLPRYDITEQS